MILNNLRFKPATLRVFARPLTVQTPCVSLSLHLKPFYRADVSLLGSKPEEQHGH
jgi:hypothetical protein